MIPRRISLLLMLFAGAAQADTLYKCTDPAGHTTYTNQKGDAKNCVILSQDKPVSTFAPPPTKPRANTPTPESFPKVSSETQKGRDSDRRRILEEELASERRSLDGAKRTLAEQEAVREGGERNYQKYLDRLKPLQDSVQLHERNIEALQKELGNLK
ncbi:MAG: DUF4124 domain-containing protein [Rhodocyclaceae bacterium]|jgi:hypothetical protein|nr:DUF4124 domain-containing protein [Rhodocyclaceae bacterium]MBK6554234.1 DUF4124 domain-containing protein [Rhodocyclaceae bacterium]MBK6677811.1 DUF4124 domain-containing protein [Rhodocyclaceae bacterium]MBK9310483.1 DUF4124 domain-containing protein [Rhodocyclaceae bacterium]MBK9954445.1 DUF4124 domain-containing protein [Rhodocyclaceae bacterium]